MNFYEDRRENANICSRALAEFRLVVYVQIFPKQGASCYHQYSIELYYPLFNNEYFVVHFKLSMYYCLLYLYIFQLVWNLIFHMFWKNLVPPLYSRLYCRPQVSSEATLHIDCTECACGALCSLSNRRRQSRLTNAVGLLLTLRYEFGCGISTRPSPLVQHVFVYSICTVERRLIFRIQKVI